MGRPLLDIRGQTFGRLTVEESLGYRPECHSSVWLCRCDCGAIVETPRSALKSGGTVSCGCFRQERMGNLKLTHGQARHDGSSPPEYKVWDSMKQRCLNPDDLNFKHYGARGITICDRWKTDFEAFLADMGKRPSPKHSIDRIDNNGNYESENCRWATWTEQARNKRSNKLVNVNGISMPISAAAQIIGINRKVIERRLKRGWTEQDALSAPRYSHMAYVRQSS